MYLLSWYAKTIVCMWFATNNPKLETHSQIVISVTKSRTTFPFFCRSAIGLWILDTLELYANGFRLILVILVLQKWPWIAFLLTWHQSSWKWTEFIFPYHSSFGETFWRIINNEMLTLKNEWFHFGFRMLLNCIFIFRIKAGFFGSFLGRCVCIYSII